MLSLIEYRTMENHLNVGKIIERKIIKSTNDTKFSVCTDKSRLMPKTDLVSLNRLNLTIYDISWT